MKHANLAAYCLAPCALAVACSSAQAALHGTHAVCLPGWPSDQAMVAGRYRLETDGAGESRACLWTPSWRTGQPLYGAAGRTRPREWPRLRHYGDFALASLGRLPGHPGMQRLMLRPEWKEEVLAGAALGLALGYAVHGHEHLVVRLVPAGVFVGWRVPIR